MSIHIPQPLAAEVPGLAYYAPAPLAAPVPAPHLSRPLEALAQMYGYYTAG